MKKGFLRKALTVLRYLIENWDILLPIIQDIIEDVKEQNYKPDSKDS